MDNAAIILISKEKGKPEYAEWYIGNYFERK